ncbi:MAG: Zn-ribbon-containing protein [Actinomycetota bacterium]
MHITRLHFRCAPDADSGVVSHAIHGLLGAWRMNGQILGNDLPLARSGGDYHTYLMLPAVDSLAPQHGNKRVGEANVKLSEAGLQELSCEVVGTDPEGADPCTCPNRRSLILYTHYLSLESCLRCGDCFGTVPLYTVPPTRNGEYYDVISWQSDYQACDTLQMNCQTGERFGLREMSRLDSSLTVRGRRICGQIEASVGTPVYYYLHRQGGRGVKSERERRCPGCGGEWLLRESLHGLFDFRCEPCRLLSNIDSSN